MKTLPYYRGNATYPITSAFWSAYSSLLHAEPLPVPRHYTQRLSQPGTFKGAPGFKPWVGIPHPYLILVWPSLAS